MEIRLVVLERFHHQLLHQLRRLSGSTLRAFENKLIVHLDMPNLTGAPNFHSPTGGLVSPLGITPPSIPEGAEGLLI
jgi:hypothetical protein